MTGDEFMDNKKVEDDDEEIEFERIQQLRILLFEYMNDLSKEDMLTAIKMYEEGKTYKQIEAFLKIRVKQAQGYKNIDYYGGRTLREARKEIDDDRDR